MSKVDIIKHQSSYYKLKRKFTLEGIDDPKVEYVNKFQPDRKTKCVSIGTENGMILIYDHDKNTPKKKLMGEPWISALKRHRDLIWLSGISRSLIGLRIKDNKKIFHTNCNTNIDQYDGN